MTTNDAPSTSRDDWQAHPVCRLSADQRKWLQGVPQVTKRAVQWLMTYGYTWQREHKPVAEPWEAFELHDMGRVTLPGLPRFDVGGIAGVGRFELRLGADHCYLPANRIAYPRFPDGHVVPPHGPDHPLCPRRGQPGPSVCQCVPGTPRFATRDQYRQTPARDWLPWR